MRKKFFLVFIYLLVVWFVGIFLFGPSGVLDNIYQEKEIVRLSELVLKSRGEIETMTREYGRLLEMKEPSQAFLVEQGRKIDNIIVFSESMSGNQRAESTPIIIEKQIFVYVGLTALLILLLGKICIMFLGVKKNKGENIEENQDDSV